ncbi:protein toll-like, partial [Ostrinia furnacalis]|uniref:protein toll-like n=1 Tax=Ostrinia furnacalis TaxID=93504 RepID=UPI001038B4F8
MLDLNDGALESATAEEAAALFAGGARVRLAGNPLRCHCDNRALLEALDANKALVLDYANTTCGDGTPVAAALEALACARLGWAGPALAALCAAALAAGLAAVLLARPETRLRLKAFLHSRGVRARWLARRLEPADDDREYDAFVAHAAADRRLVAERLAPRLEAGGRRLCLYYRDWPIGAWIPAQIDASVRRSRRTLALVTPAFLRSRW